MCVYMYTYIYIYIYIYSYVYIYIYTHREREREREREMYCPWTFIDSNHIYTIAVNHCYHDHLVRMHAAASLVAGRQDYHTHSKVFTRGGQDAKRGRD